MSMSEADKAIRFEAARRFEAWQKAMTDYVDDETAVEGGEKDLAAQEAERLYDESDIEGWVLDDGNGAALCCLVSGVPVLDSDEYLIDPETNEVVLRSAIGLLPRPEEDA